MPKSNFIFEIYSEEIPAKMQTSAVVNFAKIAQEVLLKNGLIFNKEDLSTFISPQRLVLRICDLALNQTIKSPSKVGPRTDSDEKAIEGFIKAVGVKNKSELEIITDKESSFYFFKGSECEVEVVEIIKNSLPQIMQKMANSWPKLMRYDVEGSTTQIKWIRPVRNIMAIFNNQIVDFSYFGLQSNNITFLHFLLGQKIIVNSDSEYFEKLSQNFVEVNHNLRKEKIISQTQEICKKLNLKTIDDVESAKIFDEINAMCENPTAIIGEIDIRFMKLPREILILTLKLNQKFLCLEDEKGNLSDKFIFFSNAILDEKNISKIIKDNQKLVEARLSDAAFFIDEDAKIKMINRFDDLKKIIFHEKLGSLYEKFLRVDQMAKFLSVFVPKCDITLIEKAVKLSKVDLTTKTVAELPELQGVIGYYLAKKENIDEKIAQAIKEHYLPLGMNGESVKTPLGIAISIADKIDSIVGYFIINEKPSSTRDPFALRRAALSIIRIGFENNIAFPIRILVEKSFSAHNSKIIKKFLLQDEKNLVEIKKELVLEVVSFFVERLKSYLKDVENLRSDVINLVIDDYLANLEDHKTCDILYLAKKIRFIQEFLTNKKYSSLISLYKRLVNILAIEEKKDQKKYGERILTLGFKSDLKTDYEKKLYKIIKKIKTDYRKLVVKGDFVKAVEILLLLENPLKNFFDNVLINDKNKNAREDKLTILAKIRRLFHQITDFSKIDV
jgi:glycyl-tRNA synthetase beta chain